MHLRQHTFGAGLASPAEPTVVSWSGSRRVGSDPGPTSGALPMDAERFDRLTRQLATGHTRRGMLRGLLGTVLAGTVLTRQSSPARAAICVNASTGTVCTCETAAACTTNGCGGDGCCTPNCDGTTCGDDGCGGLCACPLGLQCSDGVCGMAPCTPTCDGKTCGDDGCGGSCGTCQKRGQTCNSVGQCVTPPKCKPTTCRAQGITCGSIADGCGDTLQCGRCKKHGQTCNSAGQCV